MSWADWIMTSSGRRSVRPRARQLEIETGLGACLVQPLQKLVRRKLDLFVAPFGRPVLAGDQARSEGATSPRSSHKGGLIHMVVTLDFDTILVWIVVGLVAGFFASHLALGHGLGIVGDVIAGVVGALVGGFLAGVFHWSITIVGHPILSAMVIAFIGALIVLMVVRLFAASGVRRRAY